MKKLRTLEESNARNRTYYQDPNTPIKNGIACPTCGEELWDSNPYMILASNPAKKNIHCDCGYRGYRVV